MGADKGGIRVVRNTAKGSPAYVAGIDQGDLITAVDGQAIEHISALNSLLQTKKPGDGLTFTVQRFGEELTVTVVLAANPAYEIVPQKRLSSAQKAARNSWLKQ
ncbi:PDZ domain-containing protein [Croceiramulus getboli]